jgi:glycosyltransferase involved in cell wall biosynthesis
LSPRIIHTIDRTNSERGGPPRCVPALCDALLEMDADAWLLTGVPADSRIGSRFTSDPSRTCVVNESPLTGKLTVGGAFQRQLRRISGGVRAGDPVVIHDNGIWLPSHRAIAQFAARHSLPRVVSAHGSLTPWALHYRRWKKRLAWLAYQRRDLATASGFHATTDIEATDIRNLGFRQPIAVIPYVLDLPSENPPKRMTGDRRTVLFMSRIHPKKGLLNLLRAWKMAELRSPWRLVIAGPDERRHRREVEQLANELRIEGAVSFPGQIDDRDKWQWYADADVFVLPSFSENFGLVVPEALSSATPVITTTGTPWRELLTIGAGWQVEPNAESLAVALQKATAMTSDELATMGCRGAHWVRTRFSSHEVARQMNDFYRWLCEGGNPPKCVQCA